MVENTLSQVEIEDLRRETVRICRGELGAVDGLPMSYDEETMMKSSAKRYISIFHTNYPTWSSAI
jgi:hypothetical protein